MTRIQHGDKKTYFQLINAFSYFSTDCHSPCLHTKALHGLRNDGDVVSNGSKSTRVRRKQSSIAALQLST